MEFPGLLLERKKPINTSFLDKFSEKIKELKGSKHLGFPNHYIYDNSGFCRKLQQVVENSEVDSLYLSQSVYNYYFR